MSSDVLPSQIESIGQGENGSFRRLELNVALCQKQGCIRSMMASKSTSKEQSCHRSMRRPLAFLTPPRISYIASERANGLLDVDCLQERDPRVKASLVPDLWAGSKSQLIETGELDGIVYMSVVALQEKISGIWNGGRVLIIDTWTGKSIHGHR